MNSFQRPIALSATHDASDFDCGIASLNQWLKERSYSIETAGFSRTFVTTTQGTGPQVLGYYCLAAGSVSRSNISKADSRSSPEPIPVIVLGRLAVDLSIQNLGAEVSLLQDAIARTSVARESIGAKVLLVHAVNDSAADFYLKFGFRHSPFDSRILYLHEI